MPDREVSVFVSVFCLFVCVFVEDFSATMVNYGDEAGVSDTCYQKKGERAEGGANQERYPSGANTQVEYELKGGKYQQYVFY